MEINTYAGAREALESGETSCVSLVSTFLERIDEKNAKLNAFTSIGRDYARARAEELDREIAAGTWRKLTGLILGVKDVICVRDTPTTCGSRMLENFNSLYTATAVRRLEAEGAIVIGKLNCDEFAMGSSNENSYFGPVRNPNHLDYVPGGSSGGSAAAVAADLCQVALGSDTGGSIRLPAAFTGVVGLKPTYGRVSRFGLVAYASSLDVIGPLAHTTEDCALVMSVMAGHDPRDATSAPVPVPSFDLTANIEGLRIGLPKEYFGEGLTAGVRSRVESTVDLLRNNGAEVVDIELPHTAYGIATYYILATAEAASNLARYDGVRYGHRADVDQVKQELETEAAEHETRRDSIREDEEALELLEMEAEHADTVLQRLYRRTRAEGFGPEVKRRIMLGTYVLSAGYYEAYYARAQKVRRMISRDFEEAFATVDVLLTPATPAPAFKLGEKIDDPLEMYLTDVYTVTANLAGIPGVVIPIGTDSTAPHLPVGLQLLGRAFEEPRLLALGREIAGLLRE